MSQSQASHLPLPPGRSGPPLIGETLRFLKDGHRFVAERVAQHGPVFRTTLLGKKAAVICGPDATQLFNDPQQVTRVNAMPGNIKTLFAGDVMPTLDGEAHRERKQLVLAAFDHPALDSYIPKIRANARATLSAAAGRGAGPILEDLQRFSLRTILDLMIGLSEGPLLDRMLVDYRTITDGLLAVPLPLPGTGYSKAKKALSRALEAFGEAIAERRARPQEDGLSLILAARSPRDGRSIGDEAAAGELHHIVIAGFIVWTWLLSTFKELAQRPAVLEPLRQEVMGLAADAGYAAIEELPILDHATRELERYTPVLPIVFGRAKTDIAFKGHRIPAGWTILWAWHESHMQNEVYQDAKSFDPARFDAPRKEHEKHACAFAPQGSGDVKTGHKCVGFELGPLMTKVFIIELLRGYDIEVPDQDWSHDPKKLPAAPRSGLVVKLRARKG